MEFNSKRFLKLAGLPDDEPVVHERSSSRQLVESTRQAPVMSADEQKLRSLIRREALRMISERRSSVAVTNHDVASVQKKKSLTEAVMMGFAGFGFGGKSPVLGGPMTSASRFVSLREADGAEDEEGTLEMEETDSLDESDGLDESRNQKDDDYNENEEEGEED